MTQEVPRYDLKGLKCPLPVLKARKRLGAMPAGATIWVETTDPLASIDIPAFCADSGHILLRSERLDDHCAFLIERGPGG